MYVINELIRAIRTVPAFAELYGANLEHFLHLKPIEKSNYEILMEPTKLKFNIITIKSNRLKNAIRKKLKEVCTDRNIKEIMNIDKEEWATDVINMLDDNKKSDINIINAIYESSIIKVQDHILAKFENSTTIASLLGYAKLVGINLVYKEDVRRSYIQYVNISNGVIPED